MKTGVLSTLGSMAIGVTILTFGIWLTVQGLREIRDKVRDIRDKAKKDGE